MKLSKSILTALVAGTTAVTLTTSCEKESFEDMKITNDEVLTNGEVDEQKPDDSVRPYGDCPACGLG